MIIDGDDDDEEDDVDDDGNSNEGDNGDNGVIDVFDDGDRANEYGDAVGEANFDNRFLACMIDAAAQAIL
jgi:hypothetical protein